MLVTRFVASILSVSMMMLGAEMVSGQNYPNKPIRIVTSGVGGGSDFVARQVGQGISGPLGQAVIVENRGTPVMAITIVAKASPDGYTLLVGSNSMWVGPLLEKMSYDPVMDFSPITTTTQAPLVLVVYPSLPVSSVKELIAYAKARPGELNYASGSTGATNHLAGELLKAMAGINMVRIAYKGGAAAMNDVLSGQVQMNFGSGSVLVAQIKAGRLRALGVTSLQPSALYPGLPTLAASGVPGYEILGLDGVLAPAKTPAAIINRLNREMRQFLAMAEVKERFLNVGVEASGSSPEEFAHKMKSEIAVMSKLIKDAGIKAD